MAILQVPLQPVANQQLSISLGNQSCNISVYQLIDGSMYFDLSVAGVAIVTTRMIVINQPLVRAAYTGFVGELMMIDTRGSDQPSYKGLNSRWILLYG
jgi:hypothetical protein